MKTTILLILLSLTAVSQAADYRCEGKWKHLNFNLSLSEVAAVVDFDADIEGTYLDTLKGKTFTLPFEENRYGYLNYYNQVKVSDRFEDYQNLTIRFNEVDFNSKAFTVTLEVGDVRWKNHTGGIVHGYGARCNLLP
jgi:hypothetical protein